MINDRATKPQVTHTGEPVGRITRRGLLQNAGWLIAAASLPGSILLSMSAEANTSPVGPVAMKLSTYMSEAQGHALPAAVVEQTKLHILDTLAAEVSGSQLPPGRFAIKFAHLHAGEAVSTVAASDILCDPIMAAFANAMLAHSDETDDSHAPSQSHPGCSIVPSAWAVGEQFGIDGTRLLRAVALGYDVGTRVTMALGVPGFKTANNISTHSMAGIFGSAAASASIANLNPQPMRWVLDYASQQSAGNKVWQRDTDHIEKAFVFAGQPARNGTTAALLVHEGATGVNDVLSGADSLFEVFNPKADPAVLVDKLGERYEITRTNIKKWTVGSPIQAPLDALENLQKKHPFSADQVQKVIVRVAPSEAALVNNREMPDICLQYMVAVMLIDKTASFRAAHDKARMQDPAVMRQRAKVDLVFDEPLEHELPKRVAIVEVTLTDGTELTERVDAVRGTEENPMTREEVVAKCRDLIAPVLGESRFTNLSQKVLSLEDVKDIRELRPLLQRT